MKCLKGSKDGIYGKVLMWKGQKSKNLADCKFMQKKIKRTENQLIKREMP